MAPIVLVDGGNTAYRSHFAFQGLSNDQDRPTGTFYGFLKAVLKLRKISDRLIFCWDNGIPGCALVQPWRKKISKTYKSNRTQNEDTATVHSQLPLLVEVIENLGYWNLGIPGLEADDLCGLISSQTDQEFLIYSNDEDMFQLLEGDRVKILKPNKESGGYEIRDQAWFWDTYNLHPSDWIMVKALGGCTTDNVKPIPKVGEGTAIKWVRDLGVCMDPEAGLGIHEDNEKVSNLIAEHYDEVTAAFNLVKIPRNLSDDRLTDLVSSIEMQPDKLKKYQRYLGDRDKQLQRFTQFCADYNLNEFLADRWKFFERMKGHGASTEG